jgi:hypothetical protein
VFLDPDGLLNVEGDVTHLGGEQVAIFEITGPANTVFDIIQPVSILITSTTNSADTMVVDNFFNIWELIGAGIFQTDDDGVVEMELGAELHVAPNQPAGFYTGTFQVTVDFSGGGGGGPLPQP